MQKFQDFLLLQITNIFVKIIVQCCYIVGRRHRVKSLLHICQLSTKKVERNNNKIKFFTWNEIRNSFLNFHHFILF